jgi:hypothetical protein
MTTFGPIKTSLVRLTEEWRFALECMPLRNLGESTKSFEAKAYARYGSSDMSLFPEKSS